MMLKIKTLSVKNFLSVGNVTQAVNLDRKDLTLVLGENLDLGGEDAGSRNGVGKTAIVNALSYALYGSALSNIRKDNLINRTNAKNMLVTVDFEVGTTEYRIERGRKPTFLKLFINGQEQATYEDDSQGDSRETQKDIDRLIGLSHDMFKHIIALNTYSEPFLSMRANDQRIVIEQLLGITILSEKAEQLKEQIRITKETITEEEMRIKAVQDANKRIEDQIISLKNRKKLWNNQHEKDIEQLIQAIKDLENINIDLEIQSHRDLAAFHEQNKKINELNRWIKSLTADMQREEQQQTKLKKEINDLKDHKCYACGQELHDQSHEKILNKKLEQLKESSMQWLAHQTQYFEHTESLKQLDVIKTAPRVFYDSLEQALNHRSTLENLNNQLAKKQTETDPYQEQIVEMQNNAIEIISWDKVNNLTQIKDHQEFLLKLLINKDSFVRKRIIDQNLAYLNLRLRYYLNNIGLPHEVKFLNDLTVEISELDRELDFHNLSRGEMNRLILSLSWAFRDVWEGLYSPINLIFIDEMIDSGMDSSGVENAIAILKKMSRERNKSIFLISHKDELSSRVNNVMKIVKENGFTNFSTDIDLV